VIRKWTQYEEDSCRLPEGFTRIAYDADTRRYTFRDREGHIYMGAPGEEYGRMERLGSPVISRPVFDTDKTPPRRSSVPAPKTFHEILPPALILSTPLPSANNSPLKNARSSPPRTGASRFVNAVRRTAVPKMQIVAQNLRRPTSMGRARYSVNEDTERLLRRNSTGTISSKNSREI